MVVEPFASWPSSRETSEKSRNSRSSTTNSSNSTPSRASVENWNTAYANADAGSLGATPPPAHRSGASNSGYTSADTGSLGLTTAKSQAEALPPADYTAADAGSLGFNSNAGPGWGPIEAKVRAQPDYGDPWAAADAGSLGLHEVSGLGDPDGTFTGNIRGSYYVDTGDGSKEGQVAAGRQTLNETILHTAPGGPIQQDEFEIIELENGNYIVNLPGVIDLSDKIGAIADGRAPHIGLDPYNRSVRDLEINSTRSSISADVDDNPYAQMVRDYILENVPQGANVMLVGHSYGGDTALDLASDPTFNNAETGVNVTHAVSAGYYSQPQLDSVQDHTQVLVLENNQDAVINAESRNPLLPPEDKPRRIPIPLAPDIGFFDAPINRVSTEGDNIVISQFNGGAGSDVGHHPDRYADHVRGQDDERIEAYFESVADSGYTGQGTPIAIDVSVPEDEPALAEATSGPPTGTTTTTTTPEPGNGPTTTTPGQSPTAPAAGPTTTVPRPTPGTTTSEL